MKKKIILWFIVFIAAVGVFTYKWFDHPLPIMEGERTLNPLKKRVDVYSDQFGVPHVFASNEEDLFFTAGYIAGSDRLFQLSMVLLAVKGELASVLGEKFLDTDIYLRTWKIHETAKKLVDNMDENNRKIFESFCRGINYRIDETLDDLPIEFKILGFQPQHWDPVIVAGYTRMMAHEMSSSWKPEIVFGAVLSFFGEEKLKELIPKGDLDLPKIVDGSGAVDVSLYSKVLNNENVLRSLFGDKDADIGSNNWVVSGSRTNTGKPMLANDPHLAFTQPPRWYEIHLSGGRFNVSGVCIAGIPLPVIGQNDRTAWGFTNSMVDDLDFFIEKLNPENKNEYLFDGEWKKVQSRVEIFSIKGKDDVSVNIRETHHGPIISDIHKLLKTREESISMSWTGHWVTNEMDAWVGLTTMKNWEDFSESVKQFGVPGQNIVYADIDGNIGWRPAVYIPIRKMGFSMLPRPGYDKNYDWRGKVPYGEMPFIFNPKSGYIFTANNKTIGNEFPYYISGLWADPSRAERIRVGLDTLKSSTMDDMKAIQLDQGSNLAQIVVPHILKIKDSLSKPGHIKALKFLSGWDYVESPNSEAALIFHTILKKLTENIYKDEFDLIGEEYFNAYMNLKYLTNRNLRDILDNKYSSWIDDVRTLNKIEKINEIMLRSFISAHNEIINLYGPNWTNWKWGDAHTLTHKHLLGSQSFLDYFFSLNIGPYRSGGSDGSPNAGGYSRSNNFIQVSGASMRRIVDLNNMNETQFILPTGQSGIPKSPHYKDQAELFHNGEYRTTHFNSDSIKKDKTYKHLILRP